MARTRKAPDLAPNSTSVQVEVPLARPGPRPAVVPSAAGGGADGARHSLAAVPIHAGGPGGGEPVSAVQRARGGRAADPSPADRERSSVRDVLRSEGRPMDSDVRAEMEARLGHDFADVRIHADARAGASARALSAQAYTTGNHVVFEPERYEPGTPAGKRMLAHELTHVVQQREGPVSGTRVGGGIALSHPADRFERAAEVGAERAMAAPVQRSPGPRTGQDRPAGLPDTLSVQRLINGKVEGVDFGTWFFDAVSVNKGAYGWLGERKGDNFFIWSGEAMKAWQSKQSQTYEAAKDHFQANVHLHLINEGNDVAIVFTYLPAERTGPRLDLDLKDAKKKGKILKAEKRQDTTKQHKGGLKDTNQYKLSEAPTNTPENVPKWMVELAQGLRELAYGELSAGGKYTAWQRQFQYP